MAAARLAGWRRALIAAGVAVMTDQIAKPIVLANLTGLISTTSKQHEQGGVLGINSSVQALAQSIPPLFAGAIAAIFAPTTTPECCVKTALLSKACTQ